MANFARPTTKTLHHFSLTTALTQVFNSQGRLLSTATSFFYEGSSSDLYLVTNWHVVTGRSPSSPSKSTTGAVPCHIKVRLHRKQPRIGDKPNIIVTDIDEVSLTINSASGDDPRWIEHPEHRFSADVVALPLADQLGFRDRFEFNAANKWKEFHSAYEPDAMDEVFVVGYPWGLSSSARRGSGLPVYKRGCIASDPVVDYGKLPCLLIDCRSTPAMSGSPVIASQSGILMPDRKFTANTVIGTVSNFLGVYSGRLFGTESTADECIEVSEIGLVWKASALEAIVGRGSPGTPLTELAG